MIINHNIAALNTHRQMGSAQSAQMDSMEKLSSGLRINSAKDDAAGLTISEKMRGQIRGLEQGSRNAQDGISLIQTAEGTLSVTQDILQRMRELSVQSANDTNTADDRAEIQKEISQLTEEVDRIANTTEFNSKKLLTGEIGTKTNDSQNITGLSMSSSTQAGTLTFINSNATLATKASVTLTATAGVNTVDKSDSLTIIANGKTYNVGTTAGQTYDDLAKKITSTVDGATATWDSTAGTFKFESNDANADQSISVAETTLGALDGTKDFTTAATDTGSNASGLDAANTTFSYEGNKVTVTGGSAGFEGLTFNLKADVGSTTTATVIGSTIDVSDQLTMQIGSNEGQSISININAMDASNLGVADIDVTTHEGASSAITSIDAAIKSVSSERSKLGAVQNRLEHSINNLNTSAENLTAAESRIRDVDYAEAA
ncbi:flagellin [Planococcus donghaensis MPA1U2]|uniref:Flagellin n=1 Tax=Planococcus donghaensis MPA1U2 TaxID=933115 RepID=E7RIY4_9BACL|nr:flagellin [Planococcus donghaensis]EGA88994.1 flagellin [Planococcus donghaensis MPA1U2]